MGEQPRPVEPIVPTSTSFESHNGPFDAESEGQLHRESPKASFARSSHGRLGAILSMLCIPHASAYSPKSATLLCLGFRKLLVA
jgi:hypothetical protein